MKLFKKKKRLNTTSNDELRTALSDLETELIALESIAEVMLDIPPGTSGSVYLSECAAGHVKNLRGHFQKSWNLA